MTLKEKVLVAMNEIGDIIDNSTYLDEFNKLGGIYPEEVDEMGNPVENGTYPNGVPIK